MFKSKEDMSNYITRTEAESEVERLNRRAASLEERGLAELEALNARVTALETLARQLRNSDSVRTQEIRLPRRPVNATSSTHDRTGLPVREHAESVQANRIDTGVGRGTVDYGAVAFGLAEMKREIKSQFGVTDAQMASKWAGTVKYFSDVFAKSDPAFDAAEFARLASA